MIMKDVFELQNPLYHLRSSSNQFRRDNIKITHCGLQFLIMALSPKILELVSNNIKCRNSFSNPRHATASCVRHALPK